MTVARGPRFVEHSGSVLLPAVVLAHVVSIHAVDADRAQLAAAVEGCNQAFGDDRCGSNDEGRGGPEQSWAAELRWLDAERRRAHVRLTRSGEGGVEVVTRDVEFDADDPLEHRYRALGLIVAAYVIASGPEGAENAVTAPVAPAMPEEPDPDPPVEEHRSKPPVVAARERSTDTWGIDGAVVGDGSSDVGLRRLGAALKPWWRFRDGPALALGQLRWTRSEQGELQVDFLAVSAGLGLHLASSAVPLALELRGELVGERALLRAQDAAAGRSERAGAWRLGARAGADVLVPVVGGWTLFVGGELSLLRPRLVVEVAGEAVGREPWLGVGGLAGLRWQARP